MSKIIQYTCDRKGCASVKGSSNGWWVVQIMAPGRPLCRDEDGIRIVVVPFEERYAIEENSKTLCSQCCVVAEVSEFLSEANRAERDSTAAVGGH